MMHCDLRLRGPLLLAILALTAAPGGTQDANPTPAARRVLTEGKRVTAQVIAWLASRSGIPFDANAAATEAMRFLAEVRDPEAVPVLRKHWTFWRSNFFAERPGDSAAVAALAHIGLPALSATMAGVADGYEGESIPLLVAVNLVEMPCPVYVAAAFERQAEREVDAVRAARLRDVPRLIRTQRRGTGQPPIPPPGTLGGLPEPLHSDVTRVLEQREAVIEQLSDWLLSMADIAGDEGKQAAEAMRLLGEFRSPDGVAALRKHAAFHVGTRDERPEDFVALIALSKIGLPALTALTDVAAEGSVPEGVLALILASMAPRDTMAAYIETVAQDEIDPDRYARLQALASALRESGKTSK